MRYLRWAGLLVGLFVIGLVSVQVVFWRNAARDAKAMLGPQAR